MAAFERRITLYGLTMIAIGSSIGSGIFVTPGTIAQELGHPYLVLLVWFLGGVMGICGALTFSELGGLFQQAGGVYSYLKNGYGNLFGFLYGWVMLFVINTGSLAGLCIAFSEYLGILIPGLGSNYKTGIAACTLLLLTAINLPGVKYSQWASNILTTIKVSAIILIVLAGLFFYNPSAIQANFHTSHTMPEHLFVALFTGMVGVFFSVGGWHHATYVAGEVIDPAKTISRAMILAMAVITISYLLINIAYMRLLPLDQIAASKTIASDAIHSIFPWGAKLVALGIALSIFGTISIYSMSAPRIYYAMAADGLFFSSLARIHPRWHTPVSAMLFQCFWALCILFFFKAFFDRIITFVTFMDSLFFALAAASLFIFRKKLKEHPRPYKTWGYPLIPLVFITLQTVFAITIFFQRPEQALPGLVLLFVGVLVFYWFQKRNLLPSH
jgi:basic amino acid/polyamine antiporter, APA family